MKIDLTAIDTEQFIVRNVSYFGENLTLVFPPHIGTVWNKQNLIFRSSVWNDDGELVSASFKKFFNWGEKPELAYTPFSTKANGGVTVMEKVDGSTLIISKYKGNLIHRTRGTVDATQLDNGLEILGLMEKYPNAFDLEVDEHGTANYSLLFEWVSPTNKIVVNYPEPDMILIGKINHDDYTMASQSELDKLALELGVKRPKTYQYDSIKDILNDVPAWEKSEGVCVYCNKGQDIRKLKSEWYLSLHRMKSELCSLERVIDVFFGVGKPSYNEFYSQLIEIYDYEIVTSAQGYMSNICDAWKEVNKIVEGMETFTSKVKALPSRKEQAAEILSSYGETNRAKFVFSLLDGKELADDNLKKLLYQVMKK